MVNACEKESEMCRLVEQAHAGLHVPPEDPIALSNAILELKNNEELRMQLGQNGRAWAERKHSPKMAKAKFEQLLSDAIRFKEGKPIYES